MVRFQRDRSGRSTIHTGDCIHEELHGQDECTMNVIFTCHTYLREGWKIFWSQNKFLYSDFFQFSSYYPPSMTSIRHMSLRLVMQNHERIVDDLVRILGIFEPFKALKTLRIHLVTDPDRPPWGPYLMGVFSCFPSASRFYRSYQQSLNNVSQQQPTETSSGPASSLETFAKSRHPALASQLDEFTIDGLADSVMLINTIVLRLASTAVNPLGRIGLGIGEKGRRYHTKTPPRGSTRLLDLHEDQGGPELTWLRLVDVDDWISEHATDAGHETLSLDMPTLRGGSTDPLFKGWCWGQSQIE